MLISQLMLKLDELMFEYGNIEVGAQSGGCCNHVHEILSVEYGGASDLRDFPDGVIAIRV